MREIFGSLEKSGKGYMQRKVGQNHRSVTTGVTMNDVSGSSLALSSAAARSLSKGDADVTDVTKRSRRASSSRSMTDAIITRAENLKKGESRRGRFHLTPNHTVKVQML